jgi:PKD repeat protein
LQPNLKAEWTFKILDVDSGMVSFHDESIGEITSWKWDFGDGTTSNEQNPIHDFGPGVRKMITLEVTGPKGSSKRTRYWDVITK